MNNNRFTLLLSAEDLARELKISIRSVWRRDSAGQIPPPVRIGRCVRWRSEDIRTWLDAGCPDRRQWEALAGPNRLNVGKGI
jgi:predicted DNA-binding transcriptional regulator AlpA